MSASEQQFVTGMLIICGIALIVKHVTHYLFYKTLTEKDSKLLESKKEVQNGDLSRHTVILALINFISRVAFFLNSAILGAMLLKGYL